jgi:hypothetical protein
MTSTMASSFWKSLALTDVAAMLQGVSSSKVLQLLHYTSSSTDLAIPLGIIYCLGL